LKQTWYRLGFLLEAHLLARLKCECVCLCVWALCLETIFQTKYHICKFQHYPRQSRQTHGSLNKSHPQHSINVTPKHTRSHACTQPNIHSKQITHTGGAKLKCQSAMNDPKPTKPDNLARHTANTMKDTSTSFYTNDTRAHTHANTLPQTLKTNTHTHSGGVPCGSNRWQRRRMHRVYRTCTSLRTTRQHGCQRTLRVRRGTLSDTPSR
jgi:hypothetical protein